MTKGSEQVQRRRKKVKRMLIEALGGACWICGYYKCQAALEFHHIDPTQKEFGISQSNIIRSYERTLVEAMKCALLCANCHREVEAGIVVCPLACGATAARLPVKEKVEGSNPSMPAL